MMPKKPKYMIMVMVRNPDTQSFIRKKILHTSNNMEEIHEYWRKCKSQKKPLYCAENRGRARTKLIFDLTLVYPKNRWSTEGSPSRRDSLGRNQKTYVGKNGNDYRIKEIISWWEEEKIYDAQQAKHIYFNEMLNIIMNVKEHGTVFVLNNKIFVQIDYIFSVYQNKNINDALRLFILLRSEVFSREKRNLLFVRPISITHKKMLYDMLVTHGGFKRSELLRHYSY